jgi:hypothetical protein
VLDVAGGNLSFSSAKVGERAGLEDPLGQAIAQNSLQPSETCFLDILGPRASISGLNLLPSSESLAQASVTGRPQLVFDLPSHG